MYSPLSEFDALCPHCVRASGLCERDDCRRQVLPQLARPTGLLRLIGEARVEQTKRQSPKPAEKVALAKIARRNARRIARTQRRGMYGLIRAITSK